VFRFGAHQQELELEKTRLERAKAEYNTAKINSKLNGRDSNGNTPRGGQSPKKPKDYFSELREHFEENNDTFRYCITKAKYSIKVWDGDDIVHQVNFANAEDYIPKVRNLYLMFFDCQYKIETFLEKSAAGDFKFMCVIPIINLKDKLLEVQCSANWPNTRDRLFMVFKRALIPLTQTYTKTMFSMLADCARAFTMDDTETTDIYLGR